MTQPLFSLHDVGKRFPNGTSALEGLNLDVRPGEFLTILGPSGCGKSTVLRLLAGLDAPSSGHIEHAGGAISRTGETGFVFQEPTLMPWVSVLDNVLMPLKLARLPRHAAERQAREALSRVGLEGFAASWPRQLSGGMKMRVSLARALVTDPALLLMDEPFAALDEITRQRLNDDLLTLWAGGEARRTVLFVTHSVYEAVYLSSRVIVMSPRPGRIIVDLAIEAPAPRPAGFRHSPDYADYCRRLSEALAEAMAA